MAATMGMILDIGTCKTKRVSDENFSPYPLIVTPRHSGFDAGRRQNTNAQACLIAAYQAEDKRTKGYLTATVSGVIWGGNVYGYTDAGQGSCSDVGVGAFYFTGNENPSFTKIDIASSIYTNIANQKELEVTFNGISARLKFWFCQDYNFGVGNECTFRIEGDPFNLKRNFSGKVSVKAID